DRAGRSKRGRVAAEDARAPGQAESLDVAADRSARRHRFLDEERVGSAAREGLEAEGAGAGEKVEHARALDRVAMSVREDVEDRLAQAVGGRTGLAPGGRGEQPAAQLTADDAHRAPPGSAFPLPAR